MRLIEALVLGVTQGLTEFLPVSSSAHLRLVPEAVGWSDPGASFTAVVQLGTIAAVVLAFREDLLAIAVAGWRGVRARDARASPEWALGVRLATGTVPIAIVGLSASSLIDGPLRALGAIAAALVAGSLWLWTALRRRAGSRSAESLSRWDATLVGLAQATAVIPGISRSAATMGAGVHLGMGWVEAARFSFLLSVPAIVLAGLFALRDVGDDLPVTMTAVATGAAFVSGYASIRWLLRLVATGRLGWFVAYRCGLAAAIVVVLLVQ